MVLLIKQLVKVKFVIILLFFIWIFLATAWIGDDIIISLRQVFNFIQGDGFTYNYNQRVQAFTHPAWVLILTTISYITRELFYTTLAISAIFSIASIFILLKFNERSQIQDNTRNLLMFFFIVTLGFSKAFTDYMTSGLENPLSFFVIGLAIYLLSDPGKSVLSNRKKTIIFLLLATAFLNRFDYAILLSPVLFYLLFVRFGFKRSLLVAWPGILIIFAWFTFAIIYFGAPFPNTFYAKLGAGYPTAEVIQRGLNYYIVVYQKDPLTLLLILLGIISGLASKSGLFRALAIGMILYGLYIIKSGGDFMMGRFFSVLAYISIFNICYFIQYYSKTISAGMTGMVGSIILLTFSASPMLSDNKYKISEFERGVADERGFFYSWFGLLSETRDWPEPKKLPEKAPENYKIRCGNLGYYGITSPDTYYIDPCGLGDAFIARLPAKQKQGWRIGHHYRKVPTNYGLFLLGKETLLDDKLQPLLDDVTLAVSGDIFSTERFKAIYRLNISKPYKYDQEKYKNPSIRIPEVQSLEVIKFEDLKNHKKVKNGKKWDSKLHLILKNEALILINDNRKVNRLNISLDNNDFYSILINDSELYEIEPVPGNNYGVYAHDIVLENPTVIKTISVQGNKGDGRYSMAHLILIPSDGGNDGQL